DALRTALRPRERRALPPARTHDRRRGRPRGDPESRRRRRLDGRSRTARASCRTADTGRTGAVKVTVLSGGVGGARFLRGLVDVVDPAELTVIGNVGDDLEILGLHVSPDLDSLLYTLGGLIDAERGWGRAGESWNALESAGGWGGADWFRLGDRDIGLHLVRTEALRNGARLSVVTADLCRRAGLTSHIVPATDDPLRTHVITPAGRFPFQEWFVGRRHQDEVDAVEYEGADTATPAPGVLEALD